MPAAKGRIPESFISDLLARVDIYEVVAPRVELKRAGREWRGLSPFNDEKTPSFYVNQAKQMFFDFSSGKNGNAIGFLMEYERLDFVEAVEELATLAGVEVPREAARGPGRAELAGPIEALEQAQKHFRNALVASASARAYLERRGIDDETAERFGLGYAPDAWDSLTRRFSDPRPALAAGLLIEREGRAGEGRSPGCYDRFRNRLMFPIRDTRGRIIGFGGRALGEDRAKYLNSPETELFHKGRNLYGLYEARQADAHPGALYVVEGYMDVVGLARHGISGAVATLGTATTAEHLQLLFRATHRVVFCFDGDDAGRRAAWKALDQALPLLGGGREVAFMFLPDGHDPDSLVAERGVDAWQQAVAAAQPLSQFLIDALARDCDLTTPDGRARLVALVAPHARRIRDAATRAALMEALAPRVRLNRADLEDALQEGPREGGGGQPRPQTAPAARQKPVGRALQLLLDEPTLAARVDDVGELAASAIPGADLLAAVLDYLVEHPDASAARLLHDWPDLQQREWLSRLAVPARLPKGVDVGEEFDEIIARLRDRSRRLRVQQLLEQARSQPLSAAETAELRALTAARGTPDDVENNAR